MQEPRAPEIPTDLGLGRVLSDEGTARFVNRDGSFNAERLHLGGWQAFNAYDELIAMSWWRFIGLLLVFYLLLNTAFALLYFAIGPRNFYDFPGGAASGRFLDAFFFSVQTFGTIGYGHVSPRSTTANLLVTAEAFVTLAGQALATGIIFARFSRPAQRILFSDVAVVAPYFGGEGLMLRLVNGRRTQVIELDVEVTLSRFESVKGQRVRRFYPLDLERRRVAFFPLGLTVVHPVTHGSPLWEMTEADFRAADPELLVTVRGQTETTFQTVHARRSYRGEEVRWAARFVSMYLPPREGRVAIDVRRLSLTEPAPLEDAPVVGAAASGA